MTSPTNTLSRQAIASLVTIFSMAIFLLAALAILVTTGSTSATDSSILLWLYEHSTSQLDAFFLFVTNLGGVVAITAASLLLLAYLVFKKRYYKAALLVAGVGGVAAINFLLKIIFERPRPDLWEWLITETQFSFPSGHASASSALALCIVVMLWNTKWRVASIIIAALYIVVIGISRLYLGVHFPTDILGGWLVSTAVVSLVTLVLYRYTQKRKTIS